MMRKSLATAFALLLSVSPLAAQEACTPQKLNSVMDQFSEPFGAITWRKLSGLETPAVAADSSAYDGYAASNQWRERVAVLAPDMPSLQQVPYECRIGYALDVVNARVNKLGAADPYIKQWLKAQDKVLRACESAPVDQTVLPPPLDFGTAATPEKTKMQSDDRAYQEAAITFYRDKSTAVQMFKAIGASDSEHRAAARYTVANALANANNVVGARAEADSILADLTLASVHEITKQLQGYIANLADTPEAWSQLIDNVVAELAKPMSAVAQDEKSKARFGAALYDLYYAGIRAKQDDWWIANRLPENPTLSKAVADAARKHPLALWVMAGKSVEMQQSRGPWTIEGAKHEAWAASYVDRALQLKPAADGVTGSARDLLLSFRASTDQASREAQWAKVRTAHAAAMKTCGAASETAALLELTHQATRISALAGDYDQIYRELATLKLESSKTYQERLLPALLRHVLATGNAVEGRRLRDRLLTADLFAATAGQEEYQRNFLLAGFSDFMLWVAEDEAHALAALKISGEKLGSPLLNLLPASTLRRLAGLPEFDLAQKALLSRAAWTRDFARGLPLKKAISEDMLSHNPDVAKTLAKVKADYPNLSADKHWLLTILRQPRLGILVNSPDYTDPLEAVREDFSALDLYDHNDKNWWCPLQTDRHLQDIRRDYDESSTLERVSNNYDGHHFKDLIDDGAVAKLQSARDTLLKQHPWIKAVDWNEVEQLSKTASAPRNLSQSALRWGKQVKSDDGAAEALALSVRASRYGCNWHGGHKAYTKPAQEMLQKKFGKTKFASETPYWFDCQRWEYDKEFNRVATCAPRPWERQKPLQ